MAVSLRQDAPKIRRCRPVDPSLRSVGTVLRIVRRTLRSQDEPIVNEEYPAIGRIGIYGQTFDRQPMSVVREAAREIEELGFGAIWFPEPLAPATALGPPYMGREAIAQSAMLLSATERIVIATGVARITGRDPVTLEDASQTLAEAFPGRFVLGLGGHGQPLQEVPGRSYPGAVTLMREYLDAMDAAPPPLTPPDVRAPRVLAAIGPKMLKLAGERTWGAHPYFVPVEHTARAREILGPGALLAVEQMVVMVDSPEEGREIADFFMSVILPIYERGLRGIGFDEDLDAGGSPRLTQALVTSDGLDAAVERVNEHLEAGADHVCISVATSDINELPRKQWRELAGALL